MSPLATVKQYSPKKRTAPVQPMQGTPVALMVSRRLTELSEIIGPSTTTHPASTSAW